MGNDAARTLLALVSPLVAIAIAIWGFRRSTRADKLEAFFRMFERYLAPDVRMGRQLVHRQISGRSVEEIEALDQSIRTSVGYSLAVMNSIAIACEAKYVDSDVVARSMGRSFATTMAAAGPYVDYLEKVRGFRPYPYAERLAPTINPPSSRERRRPSDSSPAE